MGDLFGIKEIGYLKKGLDMRLDRQNAITSNIANASTPGYKEVSVKFEDKLKAALGRGFQMAETHPGHLPNHQKGVAGIKADTIENKADIKLDGNNVNLDKQIINNVANSIDYNLLVESYSKISGHILLALKNGK